MTSRSTAMGADNVLLFILVWTVCQADDNVCSISCEDVTGTVGKEADLTCSVSQKSTECCITMYKFQYLEKYKNSAICRQDLPQGSCEQRNSFTCRYTPTTAMMRQFRFYVQTTCGMKIADFTVNITEPSKPLTDTEDQEPSKPLTDTEYQEEYESGSTAPIRPTVVGAVVGCIIIIIFIIGILVSCVKRSKRSIPSGSQIEYERGASEKLTITTVNDQNETK